MESTVFFEKKISLTPKDLNKIKTQSVDELITAKGKELVEGKCSEHGFVLPGSITLISHSMGYYESARFTGDTNYYAKFKCNVIYPADTIRVTGEVIRKNKMGLYVVHRDAIRIQVPRDLHLGNEEYENVQIGDTIEVELKRSKFQINDPYILASALFIQNKSGKNEVSVPALAPAEEPAEEDLGEGALEEEEEEEFESEEQQVEGEEEEEEEGEGKEEDEM
jgi:hypothetical protein